MKIELQMQDGIYRLADVYGGVELTYDELDEEGELYSHPFFGSSYVWAAADYELPDLFDDVEKHGLASVLRCEFEGILLDLALPIPA